MHDKELVVAVCKENIEWINDAALKYDKVTVYDKCEVGPAFDASNVSVRQIPNVGSCDNAFLTYITERYDTLPKRVEFTEGARGDHKRYFICSKKPDKSICSRNLLSFNLKHWEFTNNRSQDFKFVQSSRDNMREWVKNDTLLTTEMFDDAGCNVKYGGHFGATREQIQNMPIEVYKNLKEQQMFPNEEIDHYIERSWGTMFCTTKNQELDLS